MTALIYLIFFSSGLAALVFEALWFRQAGLALGSSIWASSLVLAGFMGGLALGNGLAARYGDRVRNPVFAYAVAEVAIAVTGIAIVFWLPGLGVALTPLIDRLLAQPLLLNALRLGLAFLVLLVPSTAMGVTLPLLTRTLMRYHTEFGVVLGKLYGWNTLGATAGAIVGEVYLIGMLGIRGTALAAGAVNLAAGAASLWLSRRLSHRSEDVVTAPTAWHTPGSGPWLGAAFLSGFCLLALEVTWFRLLLLFVMGHAVAFAVMLSVVLAGIALGGLAAGRWFRTRPDAARVSAAIACTAGVACLASYALFPLVVGPFETTQIMTPSQILQVGLPLMFPVSLLSGILFTALALASATAPARRPPRPGP